MIKNKYRTHTCGELRLNNVNENVKIAGWVSNIRKLGGLTFITLRDHFGTTQIICDEKLISGICTETVVSCSGTVKERESKNAKMPTGDIEVIANEITVLGDCKNVLPFEIASAPETKEELRLKYRYLDLRNEKNHNLIVERSNFMFKVRNVFHDLDFTEVQTPILTSSSPEGARDFLVPSRLNPGKFYALPQSPQQFKQLLMISGFDRYFQLAPCFRDEDARADRSPGEFYQADFEMAFATQDDVFEVLETVMPKVCEGYGKQIVSTPFERIPYLTAMDKYCSDKPDLRNPLICHDVSQVFAKTEFNAFKGKTIKAVCANCQEKTRAWYDSLIKFVQDLEGKGLAYIKYTEEGLNGSVVKFLSEQEKHDLLEKTEAKLGETIFLIADTQTKATKLMGTLRNKLGAELNLIDNSILHFCWIVDFPFYEWNEDTNSIDFGHNPFTMPQGGLEALNSKDPLSIMAYQFDLVLNGVELASGAVRNHKPEVMVKAFELAGYNKEVVENKFPALYNAFSYGAPPHAGAAFGFDRLLMILHDCEFIRDVIAFPLNKNAQDLLMSAPNTVFPKQLKDVHIKIDLPENK